MRYRFCLLILLVICWAGGCKNSENELKITEYVNPFSGEGHSPGAIRPFGGIQLGPEYAGTGRTITAFSAGSPDNDHPQTTETIRLLPTLTIPDSLQSPACYFRSNLSSYALKNEKAEAGYYGVTLDNGIVTEMTVTDRCGIFYYHYPAAKPHALLIDLNCPTHRDSTVETVICQTGDHTLKGYRKSRGQTGKRRIHFVIEFSQNCRILAGKDKFTPIGNGQKFTADSCYIWIDFGQHTDKILAKLSISPANTEGAAANIEKELSHWSFDKVRKDAKQSWKGELMKIRAEGGKETDLNLFYNALYRTYLSPRIFSDVNGNYKGPDGEIHTTARRTTQYSAFPARESGRSIYPLLSITQRKRMPDFLRSVSKHNDLYGQTTANSTRQDAGHVLAAIGFYPVDPADEKFQLVPPLFKKILLKTGPEKRFLILANRENEKFIYIEKILLNKKTLNRTWITYDEIMQGGKLEFVLTDRQPQ